MIKKLKDVMVMKGRSIKQKVKRKSFNPRLKVGSRKGRPISSMTREYVSIVVRMDIRRGTTKLTSAT